MDVLRGQAYWASVRKPNEMSGKLQMDVGNMDKDSLALLKKADIPTKNKGDERGDFITLKGSPQYPPKVTDSQNNQLPEPVQIGNGSKVKVPFQPYDWDFKGKTGTSIGLNSVMILEMVIFSSGDAMEAEEGYVSTAQADLAQPEMDSEDPF
jgi:hypothetical protein